MTAFAEERLAHLIRALPPAPEAWVRAAQELAPARSRLDEIVRRADEDAAFRARVLADLESALVAEGVEPTMVVVEALKTRLAPD
jgi:hypothetical protein